MNLVKSVNKILIAVFFLVGFLFVTILPVSASNEIDSCQQKQVVFSKEPIVDEAVLYDRAKKGETDLITDQSFIKDLTFDGELVKDFNIKSYVTTQKLKEVRDLGENGKISNEESYATTIISEISPKSYNSGSTYLEQPTVDSQTASVRCTLTVYFDYRKDTIGSFNYYSAKLNSVKSKWNILDPNQMRIGNGFVRGTANGFNVTSFDPHYESSLIRHLGTGSGEYNLTIYPSSGTSYYYYPNWNNWLNVYPSGTQIGGKADITITRKATGQSWDFAHSLIVNWTNFPN